MRCMVLTSRRQNKNWSLLVVQTIKTTVLLFFVFVAAEASRLQAQEQKTVSIAKIGNVLHCLKSKFEDMKGYKRPPQIHVNIYRVRYLYGINSPQDENNNELQLIVYGPEEKSAVYYTVYFEKENQHDIIHLGQMATLIQEHGKLELDENPGGNGTYFN